MQNASGQFVAPSIASIPLLPPPSRRPSRDRSDYRVSIINPAEPTVYPISSMTLILLYANQTDPREGPWARPTS